MNETNIFEELIVMRSKGGDGTIYRQTPLVRCKDCKHKGDSYECRLDRDLEEYGSHRTERFDDWFCADGERSDL